MQGIGKVGGEFVGKMNAKMKVQTGTKKKKKEKKTNIRYVSIVKEGSG